MILEMKYWLKPTLLTAATGDELVSIPMFLIENYFHAAVRRTDVDGQLGGVRGNRPH